MFKAATYRALDALYEKVPVLKCLGLCGEKVCVPIGGLISKAEDERVDELYGVAEAKDTGHCNRLNASGKCEVYEHRPMICRVWGLEEGSICEWGCKPEERYLTRAEIGVLLRESWETGGYTPVLVQETVYA